MTRLLRLLVGYLVGAGLILLVLADEYQDWKRRRKSNRAGW
jgi:hypothetical protein